MKGHEAFGVPGLTDQEFDTLIAGESTDPWAQMHIHEEPVWKRFIYDRYDWEDFRPPNYAVVRLTQGFFMMASRCSFGRFERAGPWYANVWHDPEGRITQVYAIRNKRTSGGRRTTEYAHRFAVNASSRETVDHKNHFTLDNRLPNLRPGTIWENTLNISGRKREKHPDLPRGVAMVGGKYRAQISVRGKRVYSPCYATPEEAHGWYMKETARLCRDRGRGWVRAERSEPIFPPERKDWNGCDEYGKPYEGVPF